MESTQSQPEPIKTRLGLFDTSCIIVGIIIGVGIFETPGKVFQSTTAPWMTYAVWILGGVLSLIGALCFAELGSTYPRSGGEYVYLTNAYGRTVGFLFGWAQLLVVRSGAGIGFVAYIFAKYSCRLWDLTDDTIVVWAVAAILLLTLVNVLGVYFGKMTQNILTVAKVAGIGGIVLFGFFAPVSASPAAQPVATGGLDLGLALIFVFYTFDGWNEASYVAAEVKDQRRNLPRALILGTLAVTLIYLAVNASLLAGLGFAGAQAASSRLWESMFALWGSPWDVWGVKALYAIIVISAFGSINGMVLASSRIYAELGKDHRLFAKLSVWNRTFGTPLRSLVVQGAIAAGMVAGVSIIAGIRGTAGGFDMLVTCTSPVFWLFFLLTGLSVIVLRGKDPDRERPFRVPFYPYFPLIFSASCGYMFYSSLDYIRTKHNLAIALTGVGVLAAGWLLYKFTNQRIRRPRPVERTLHEPVGHVNRT